MIALLLAACSSESPELAKAPVPEAGAPDAVAPDDAGPDGDAADGPVEEPLGPPIGNAPAPVKLADDAVTVMGITSDGWAVFRNPQGIVAIPIDGSAAEPTLVSAKLGMVEIKGNIVFVFADVDWAKKVGELTIWTAAHGPKSIGPALYADDTAFATPDGAWVGWIGNLVQPEPPAVSDADGGAEDAGDAGADGEALPEASADLVLATPDLAKRQTVLVGIGTGSANTCRPKIGFVGMRLVAAWCAPGSTSALLQTLDLPAWAPVTVAKDVNPFWSADATAQNVLYTDLKGGVWVGQNKLDNGVGWGALLPDGSAALYTVSDQLRRAALPKSAPMPIITTGFASRAGFTPDYGHALYSTKVTYEGGVQRNLLLTPTTALNDAPLWLLKEPIAELSRSIFTTNGKWLLYLTTKDDKKTLVVRSIATDTTRSIENVDTVAAGAGSRLIYSANRSGADTYPRTADLAVMDPAAEGEPVTLQTATTDGRNFHLTSDGSKVVYMLPAQGDTPSALLVQGVP